jgi:hypothetical protein
MIDSVDAHNSVEGLISEWQWLARVGPLESRAPGQIKLLRHTVRLRHAVCVDIDAGYSRTTLSRQEERGATRAAGDLQRMARRREV